MRTDQIDPLTMHNWGAEKLGEFVRFWLPPPIVPAESRRQPGGMNQYADWARKRSLRFDRQFTFGIDPAEGVEGGDYIAGTMLDSFGEIAATLHLRRDPLVVCSHIVRMARMYGDAAIWIEHSSAGPHMISLIQGWVEEREAVGVGAHLDILEPYLGVHVFEATKKTKPGMARAIGSMLDGPVEIKDPEMWQQCKGLDPTTMKNENDGHDDLTDSFGIAAESRRLATRPKRRDVEVHTRSEWRGQRERVGRSARRSKIGRYR